MSPRRSDSDLRRIELSGGFRPNRTGVRVIAKYIGVAVAVRSVGLDAPDAERARVFKPLNKSGIVEELPDQTRRQVRNSCRKSVGDRFRIRVVLFESAGERGLSAQTRIEALQDWLDLGIEGQSMRCEGDQIAVGALVRRDVGGETAPLASGAELDVTSPLREKRPLGTIENSREAS